jgi:SET family sugar efflux transporter-like MFS transporter
MQRILAPIRILFGNREFVVVLAANLALGLASSFVTPFLSMFGTIEARMSPALFGGFMTITALSSVLIATILSHRSDTHYSRRHLMLLGAACGALGYVGYAFVRDVVLLTIIGSVALGIASITFSQLFAHARESLSRAGIPATQSPLYMNLFRMFFALSWTIGPALAALTLHRYSYQGLFLVAALFYVFLLLIVAAYIPNVPPAANSAARPPIPLRALLRQPTVFPWFVAFVLVFMATTMSMMNLSLLVLNVLGGTETQVGIIFSLAPVFELPFMIYFGLLATKIDPARLIRLAVVLGLVYFASLSLVRAPWHIYPLQILSAAFVAVTMGVAISFFQDKFPGQPGAATNLYMNAMRIGATAGYLIFGTIAQNLGHRAVYVACAVLCGVALILMFLQPGRATARLTTSPGVAH